MFRSSRQSCGFRFPVVVQLGVVGALVLAGVAGAAGGGLDPAFGWGGVVLTDFGSGTADSAAAVVLQRNGGVVAVGSSDGDFALARYRDGHLDTSFGNGGKVLTNFSGSFDFASAAAIQPDGKIVAVGTSTFFNGRSFEVDFALARYNVNGSLDSSFGNGGKALTNINPLADFNWISAVAIQSDGKIVVVGFSEGLDWAIVRYNPDGRLDPTFGSGGVVSIGPEEGADVGASSVAIQRNGKIVVGGQGFREATGFDFALIRFNADGSTDPTFGSGGTVLTDFRGFNDGLFAVAIQADGKIVAGGSDGESMAQNVAGADFALVRYTDSGSLDRTFGTGGKVGTDLGGTEAISSLVVLPNGKIVAAGTSGNIFGSGDFGLARYTDNGSLDQTFGVGGKVLTDLGGNDGVSAIVVQPNGKIVVAGSSDTHGTNDFALARYLGG